MAKKIKGKHCTLHSLVTSGNYALIKGLRLAKELEETYTLTFLRGETDLLVYFYP